MHFIFFQCERASTLKWDTDVTRNSLGWLIHLNLLNLNYSFRDRRIYLQTSELFET